MKRWGLVLVGVAGIAVGVVGTLLAYPPAKPAPCSHPATGTAPVAASTPSPDTRAPAPAVASRPGEGRPSASSPSSAQPAAPAAAPRAATDRSVAHLVAEAYAELLREGKAGNYWEIHRLLAEKLKPRGAEILAWLRAQVREGATAAERKWAIELLEQLGDRGAAPILIEALRTDPDAEVREQAAEDLGELEILAAVPDLIEALRSDPSTDVRAAAASALSGLQAAEAVPALGEALRGSDDDGVRYAAAEALSEIRSPETRPYLEEGQGDADPWVRLTSLTGLAAMGESQAVDELVREYGHVPVELSDDHYYGFSYQESILYGLAEAGNPVAAPLFREVLTNERDVNLLYGAIDGARKLKDVDALPLLERIIAQHADEDIREYAGQARDEILGQGENP